MRLSEAIENPTNGAYPVILIDGPGGSGKTTLARYLTKHVFPNFGVTHGDDYFEPLAPAAESAVPGFLNMMRLAKDIGTAITAGERDLAYSPYDWTAGQPVSRPLHINSGLIHEGIKSFMAPFSSDTKIWVESDHATRRRRVVHERTDSERRAKGRSITQLETQFEFWAQEADQYRSLVRPEDTADYIVDGTVDFTLQLADVTGKHTS